MNAKMPENPDGDTSKEDVSQALYDLLMQRLNNAENPSGNMTISFPSQPLPEPWNIFLPGSPYGGYGFPFPGDVIPNGTFRITLGTGTSANDLFSQTFTFEPTPQGTISATGQPDEAAALAQMAQDILDALTGMQPHQVNEKLAQPAPKPAPNNTDKPVKWKKAERNRLEFYKFLRKRGDFDADLSADESDSIETVLRDVAEADANVPPVPRLSDDGE